MQLIKWETEQPNDALGMFPSILLIHHVDNEEYEEDIIATGGGGWWELRFVKDLRFCQVKFFPIPLSALNLCQRAIRRMCCTVWKKVKNVAKI